MIKIPKYIENELKKARSYSLKSNNSIKKFEKWIKNNVDEDFDFDTLRALSDVINLEFQTEALTEIEHGNSIDIDELERTINYYMSNKF